MLLASLNMTGDFFLSILYGGFLNLCERKCEFQIADFCTLH